MKVSYQDTKPENFAKIQIPKILSYKKYWDKITNIGLLFAIR